MTIRKGEDWGTIGPPPEDVLVVDDDLAARQAVERARRAGDAIPPLTVRGGDLARTLGNPVPGAATRHLPIDLGAVLLDGRPLWFVSSMVAGAPLGRGRSYLAMNAAWLGPLNIAPKAHPNDGLLDILDATLTFGQSRQARRRARLGDHLPHPGIRARRAPAAQVELPRPTPVALDGVVVGRFRHISVRVEPDALTVIV